MRKDKQEKASIPKEADTKEMVLKKRKPSLWLAVAKVAFCIYELNNVKEQRILIQETP